MKRQEGCERLGLVGIWRENDSGREITAKSWGENMPGMLRKQLGCQWLERIEHGRDY